MYAIVFCLNYLHQQAKKNSLQYKNYLVINLILNISKSLFRLCKT